MIAEMRNEGSLTNTKTYQKEIEDVEEIEEYEETKDSKETKDVDDQKKPLTSSGAVRSAISFLNYLFLKIKHKMPKTGNVKTKGRGSL